MTRVTAFHPSHIGALQPARQVEHRLKEYSPEYFARLAEEPSITIWCENRPVVCAGVAGDVELWAVFDANHAPRHALAIVRAGRRFLETFPFVYANVEIPLWCQLPERLLGFVRAGVTRRGEKSYIHLERAA